MYIFRYFYLDILTYSRQASFNFIAVYVNRRLVAFRAFSCYLAGCQVRETTAVAIGRERQPLVTRPLLDDIGEAARHFSASPSNFKRSQRGNILASQDKPHAAFVSLHLHTSRCPSACIDTLACHLRAYLIPDVKQYTLDFVHHAVVDYIVVSNRHFSRVFSHSKPFLSFSNIIYQLSKKNAVEAIFCKNNS